jgi:hypothetical protein
VERTEFGGVAGETVAFCAAGLGESLIGTQRHEGIDRRVDPFDPIEQSFDQLNRRELLVAERRCQLHRWRVAKVIDSASGVGGHGRSALRITSVVQKCDLRTSALGLRLAGAAAGG